MAYRGVEMNEQPKAAGWLGKIIFSLFGSIFFIVGLLAFLGMLKSDHQLREMQDWTQTPCVIEESQVLQGGDHFYFSVVYRYTVEDHPYRGTRFGGDEGGSEYSLSELDKQQKTYPPKSATTCYFNPENPVESTLLLPSLISVWKWMLPLFLFLGVGLFLAIIPWVAGKRKKERELEKKKSPILRIMGIIFLLTGTVTFFPIFLIPLKQIQAAKDWSSTEATVFFSKLIAHQNDQNTTYQPYIAYRYTIGGTNYLGDRYSFFPASSGEYGTKAQIIQQHPVGGHFLIFVNPKDPFESVIFRDSGLKLLMGLLPLTFIVVGLILILSDLRGKRLSGRQFNRSVVSLKGGSPVLIFLGSVFFSVALGTGFFFLLQAKAPLMIRNICGLFFVIFLFMTGYRFLALFNPYPQVEIAPGSIYPGSSFSVRWKMRGKTERIQQLKISLQCEKMEKERVHTATQNKTTMRKVSLYLETVKQTSDPLEMAQGALSLHIPEELPASKSGFEDGISWKLIFHGDISRWPDLSQSYSFLVYPSNYASDASSG